MRVRWPPTGEAGPERGDRSPNEILDGTELRLHRIRAEYSEMPDLFLTAVQAGRLWGLEHHECEALLNQLVEARFLRRTRLGAFVRV